MASANTLCSEIINVKGTVVTNHEIYHDSFGVKHLRSHSRIKAFKDLSAKIKRNEKYILLTIKLGMSNARIGSINNKIKVIIRRSYGFRNIENMLSMVYLVCSNLTIPIPNRKPACREAA